MADTHAPVPTIVAGTATPSAPDFSSIALEHLAQRGDAFRQHVRDYLDRPGEGPLSELVADLQRFRNTLVLLERTGVVFVVEELLSLLEARREGPPMHEEAFAGVLVSAGERLGDHVARLGRGACGEGALSLLPLVNDSRACRGVPLLSAALLLTAGIAVPHAREPRHPEFDPSGGAEGRSNEGAAASFAAVGDALRATLARERERRGRASAHGMPGPPVRDELRETIECCRRSCDAPALAHLQALFAALGAVVDGIGEGVLEDGAAIGELFDRLVRWLDEAVGKGVPALPRELCRDLLYYVALIDPRERPHVTALHERFELGRIRSALEAAPGDEVGTSIGPHLAGAIRDSIDVETSALRQWLDQAPTAADHPRVLRLRERLAQMEPVLTLLGAREARSWLRRINESLDALSGDAPIGSAERLMLAESLLRLDRALDGSAASGPDVVLPGNLSDLPEGSADPTRRRIVDEAATRCLEEARRRLAVVGESLDAPRLVGAPTGDAELQLVERVLSALALVEVGPLLSGLRAANARIEAGSPPAVRDALATLLASLDFYLGCVMRPDEEGSRRLLRSAEEALSRLQSRLPPAARDERAVPAPTTSPSTARAAAIAREALSREVGATARATASAPPVDTGDDTAALESGEGGNAARQALACMDTIGELLMEGEEDGVAVTPLRHAFDTLAGIEGAGRADTMHALAAAAITLLDRVAAARGRSARLRPGELAPIEEAHGVLPQLIERLHGASERVRGFEALLEELRHTAVEPAGSDRGDDDESTAIALDSTLQGVFQRECAMHIDTLERAVAAASLAFERRADTGARERESSPLPSDALLRALHTLSGSAQTVEAHDIVAVVQPLQRAALARQRVGLRFDEQETRYTGELVEVLRSRLHARESGEAVDPFVHDVEARLPAFVERALDERDGARHEDARLDDDPGHDGTAQDEWSSSVLDLAGVFDEEARELLARVQEAVESGGPVEAVTDRALGHLHTLKGSARMAGYDAVAERAHALEGEVQALRNGEARRGALAAGRRELQTLLLDVSGTAVRSSAPPASDGSGSAPGASSGAARRPALAEGNETATVPTATFESLMTLATDVTVSQARLSDDMARVREACRDLESAAGRWRRLPQEGAAQEARLLDTPAAREMLADLDTARRDLSDALRLADVEQQHASRAASSLQQMLVRTRLVRVEDLSSRLAETVRDAAEDTGRQVRFVLDGGEVTLDGALCRQLRAPLEHLVRNAVVHGIEPPEERHRAGKETTGTVRLGAAVDGTDIVLVVEDDGGGVDREAVSRRREAAGREAVETVDALQDVLCEAGFTTLERPSAVGGRGLGLSAVSETLTRLDGRLHIGTRSGLGTAVTCRLRQRIVVVQVVLVRCRRRLYALPVGVITRVDEKRSEGGGRAGREPSGSPMSVVAPDVDVFGDAPASPSRPGPLPGARLPDRLSLLSLLGGVSAPAGREEGETDDTGAHEDGSAELVLDLGAESIVLEVDRVVGYRELLVQPLGPQLAALQRFSGGSVLPDGRQVLLVEPARLIGQWRTMAGSSASRSRPDPETMRPVALVVDDSITLRVAAAGMLERNGVESREARDGVEALDGLSRALPDLMIVDLDMPRLGGFDLIRRVRERLGERAPPVIVISSRDGAEDRERARVLGVVRYLTKPYTEPDLREALLASGLRLPDLTIA